MLGTLLFLLLGSFWTTAWGHGRLIEPPGRSTMWRYKFRTEPNYNDNELFCGGFDVQYHQNGGKCGICGDRWDAPEPRDNEDGGRYGKKIVVRQYRQGQVITVVVQITAHHKGYFEFRLCPMTHEGQIADQECLDRNLLQLADGTGTRYFLQEGSKPGDFPVELQLPEDLTCDRCVLQWHYNTGNRWDICKDGTGALGCGMQEVFRGCADVSITRVELETPVAFNGEKKTNSKIVQKLREGYANK